MYFVVKVQEMAITIQYKEHILKRNKQEINTRLSKSNQGNQNYSGNQMNVTKGQRPDIKKTYTQNKDHKITKIIHTM